MRDLKLGDYESWVACKECGERHYALSMRLARLAAERCARKDRDRAAAKQKEE